MKFSQTQNDNLSRINLYVSILAAGKVFGLKKSTRRTNLELSLIFVMLI